MNFKDLINQDKILQAINEMGYSEPTDIQREVIPKILEGKDIAACAETGTGKTAAFMLPILSKLLTSPSPTGKGPRALILVPTRELAMQVSNETKKYCQYLQKMRVVSIYGGVPYPKQNRELSKPFEILVATPGRLIDQLERKRIHFERLEVFVLDEADRMLDMGFIDAVNKIAHQIPQQRQTLLFSATLKESILKLTNKLLKETVHVDVTTDITSAQIEQKIHFVDDAAHKYRIISHLLKDANVNQILIFTATKAQADNIVGKLVSDSHNAEVLHSDISQNRRSKTMRKFKENKLRVLVATDIAARGIDVSTVTHVVNYDLPRNPEDYIHRIGRTGRAGEAGSAFSLVSPSDKKVLKKIEQLLSQKIPTFVIPGLEPKRVDGERKKEHSFNDRKRKFNKDRFKRFSHDKRKSQQKDFRRSKKTKKRVNAQRGHD